jgi:hypothetical protein
MQVHTGVSVPRSESVFLDKAGIRKKSLLLTGNFLVLVRQGAVAFAWAIIALKIGNFPLLVLMEIRTSCNGLPSLESCIYAWGGNAPVNSSPSFRRKAEDVNKKKMHQ